MICWYRYIRRRTPNAECNFIWVAPDYDGTYKATIHYDSKLNVTSLGPVNIEDWSHEKKRLDDEINRRFSQYNLSDWNSIELNQPTEELGRWYRQTDN